MKNKRTRKRSKSLNEAIAENLPPNYQFRESVASLAGLAIIAVIALMWIGMGLFFYAFITAIVTGGYSQ